VVIQSLVINNSYIFAGLIDGTVWRRALSGLTGKEEINNNESKIVVYPNPAINDLTIESTLQAEIEILNIQGQTIITMTSSSNKSLINVSDLPSGFYYIKVKTEKGIEVKKFVKE